MANPFANFNSPRCAECPSQLLDDYLGSSAGQLVQRTFDLEFALQSGVTVTLAEITYSEFILLRLLSEERNRYAQEIMPR